MRSRSIDLRQHVDSVMDRKKKAGRTAAVGFQPLESRNAPTPAQTQATINDLPESEKVKITKLAEKVLELNGVIEQLARQNDNERMRHAEEIRSIHATIDGQISIIEDRLKLKDATIAKLQDKEKMITSMLALYQAKLKNMADICRLAGDNEEYNKKKVTQLQADVDHFQIIIQNQKKLIESFDSTKEQLEERMKSMETRHAKRVRTLEELLSEESDRRLRAEKLNLQQSSEIVMLKAEIQKLQYHTQQMRAMQSSEQDVLMPHIKKAQKQHNQQPKPDESAIPLSNEDQKILNQVDETNPFKKYGPYDEYSLLFNNSRGDEDANPASITPQRNHKRSRPGTDAYAGHDEFSSVFPDMSPIPTPATTKVPFGGNGMSTNKDEELKNSNGGDSPSRALISQAEELLRRSRTVQLGAVSSNPDKSVPTVTPSNWLPTTDTSMPILKPSEIEPQGMETIKPPVPAIASNIPPASNARKQAAAFPVSQSHPTPVFLRESKDSIISSVNHADVDSDTEEEEEEEEEDSESSKEESDVETHGDEHEELEFDQALLSQHLSDMNLSHNRAVNESLRSNTSSVEVSKEKKKTKSIVSTKESRVSSSVEQSPVVSSSSSSKPKPFYPMRPLANSLTASVGIADNAQLTSPGKKKSASTKKEKKNKSVASQQAEASLPTDSIKSKTKKKTTTKRKSSAAVASSGQEFSFLSQESKDAVSLLHAHDKDTKHVSSSHEQVSYLPRPPPRSAQKVKPPIADAAPSSKTNSNKAKIHDIEQPIAAKKTPKKHSSGTLPAKSSSHKDKHSDNYPKRIGKYDASLFDLVDALEEGEVGNETDEE